MAQYLFGAGKIFATPIQDVYGQPIINPTPVEVGVMQSVGVDISYDLKSFSVVVNSPLMQHAVKVPLNVKLHSGVLTVHC